MHAETSRRLTSLAERVQEAALGVLWKQWKAVGGPASVRGRARSIVDPEALVLLSLTLRDRERRLWDLAADWARVGSRFLSVQRIGNLLPYYPDPTVPALREFARLAERTGKDHRWKTLAREADESAPHRDRRFAVDPNLVEASTLMLRLRTAMGVGIKADVLSFLLGVGGAAAPVRVIARATHYTEPAVRRAVDDMARAQFVLAAQGKPAEYRAVGPAWRKLLQLEALPAWMHWQEVFSFVAHFLAWESRTHTHPASDYACLVRYREFLADHRLGFSAHRLVPDAAPRLRELSEPREFEDLVARLMSRIVEKV